jgi:hypothetical protein
MMQKEKPIYAKTQSKPLVWEVKHYSQEFIFLEKNFFQKMLTFVPVRFLKPPLILAYSN